MRAEKKGELIGLTVGIVICLIFAILTTNLMFDAGNMPFSTMFIIIAWVPVIVLLFELLVRMGEP